MQADPSSPVYFILHIPKTAGETIEFHLEDHCGPGVVWRPAAPSRWAETVLGRRYQLGSLPELSRVRVVVGQHIGRSLERYFPDREIRRAVLLRDPVSLQVSFYNYMNMRRLAEGGGTYSFGLHLRALRRNLVAYILLWQWCEIPWPLMAAMTEERKYEMLNETLSAFWFVGPYTECDRLIAAIAPDLGVPAVAWPRNTAKEWQKLVDWQPVKVTELSAVARHAIRANSPLDQALWESWSSAGFDTASVRPLRFDPSWECSFSLHSVTRPAFVCTRDFLQDWLPRLTKAANRATTTKRSRAMLAALNDDPENPALWRTVLSHCHKTGRKFCIPDRLVGSVGDLMEPDFCITKGEVLLRCGRCGIAKRFLRRAAILGKSRRQAKELTMRASSQDSDFQALIAKADRARDLKSWRVAERYYRAALALYPGHFGYMVQYAHCLKEQGKFVVGEIYYRSARALGAPWSDVYEHLAFVASRQGYLAVPDPASGAGWTTDSASFLDGPPTKADVDLAFLLLTEGKSVDENQVLQLLRTQRTVREMLFCVAKMGCGEEATTATAQTGQELPRSDSASAASAAQPNSAIGDPLEDSADRDRLRPDHTRI
jgi:hypothetical protein